MIVSAIQNVFTNLLCVIYCFYKAQNEAPLQHWCSQDCAKWKRFADQLEFDSGVVNTIEVKCRSSPEECCEEVVQGWLSLDHGIGPRTWFTLSKVLKETRGCEVASEQIESEMKLFQS